MGRTAQGLELWPFALFGASEELAEKLRVKERGIPQRLKPDSFWDRFGTSELVP